MDTSSFWQQFMANPAGWLFWANAAVWTGICLYVIFLGKSQASINRRLRRLENDHE
jgi:CcmD family protein